MTDKKDHPDTGSTATPENPWDDMHVTPTTPSNSNYRAPALYGSAAPTTLGWGTIWMQIPGVMPALAICGVIALGVGIHRHFDKKSQMAAVNAQILADFDAFQKRRTVIGLDATCIQTPRKAVPAQFAQYCVAVVKASGKTKAGTP